MNFLSKAATAAGGLTAKFAQLDKDEAQLHKERIRAEEARERDAQDKQKKSKKKKGLGAIAAVGEKPEATPEASAESSTAAPPASTIPSDPASPPPNAAIADGSASAEDPPAADEEASGWELDDSLGEQWGGPEPMHPEGLPGAGDHGPPDSAAGVDAQQPSSTPVVEQDFQADDLWDGMAERDEGAPSSAAAWEEALAAVGAFCHVQHPDPGRLADAVMQYVTDLRQESADRVSGLAAQLRDAQREEAVLQQQVQDVQTAMAAATAKAEAAERESARLRADMDAKCAEVRRLEASLSQAGDEATGLKSTADAAQRRCERLQAELEAKCAALQDLEAKCGEERAAHGACLRDLQQRIHHLESAPPAADPGPAAGPSQGDVEALAGRLREAQAEAERCRALADDRNRQLERLAHRLGELEGLPDPAVLPALVAEWRDRFDGALRGRGERVQGQRQAAVQAEKELADVLAQEEKRVEQLKIKLKGDPQKGARANFRSEIIGILQKRLASLKTDLAAALKENDALEKRLEILQKHGHALGAAVPRAGDAAEDGPQDSDKLWVIFNQVESLGQCLDNAAFALSERQTKWQTECAQLEALEKESEKRLADTRVNLVATQEAGQRTAPKSQIMNMLKQRLGDLKAENARALDRWQDAEERLAETQEALRRAEQEKEDLQIQKLELQRNLTEHALHKSEDLSSQYKQQLWEAQAREKDIAQRLRQREQELQTATMELEAVTAEFAAYKEQYSASESTTVLKYQNLELELEDVQRELRSQKSEAQMATAELRSKCDQVLILQQGNQELMQEVLDLKEESDRRLHAMMQTAKEDKASSIGNQKAEISALRAENERLQLKFEAEQKEVCRMYEEQSLEKVQQLQRQLSEKEQALRALQQRLERAEKAPRAPAKAAEAVNAQVKSREAHLQAIEKEMIDLAQRESHLFHQKRGGAGLEEPKVDANQQYLKNIILQYLCAKEHVVKENLVPVLSTMLQFSPEEMQQVWKAHRGSWW